MSFSGEESEACGGEGGLRRAKKVIMRDGVEALGGRAHAAVDVSEGGRGRLPFDEERFRQMYLYESPQQQTLAGRVRKVRCGREWLLRVFPILRWLPAYEKKDIADDVIAGLTVAVMHIPQGMAYALLGGVPPIVGIYMAFFPVLVYILMGTSRHVSMGAFAVVCMMVGKSVDAYSRVPQRNATEVSQQDLPEPHTPTEIATAVCFVVGIWQVALGVLKLGSLSVLLSQTLVSGFTTGAAVHVLTSQIKNLLGIEVRRYSGPFKIVYTYMDIFQNVGNLNMSATVLSASFISFLLIFNELLKPYIQRRFKKAVPVPVEFLVVIAGTVLSQQLGMKDKFGVAVVDFVPTGLPTPSVPPLTLLPALAMDGLVTAIVAVSINISMASIFAQKLGYEIDGNQELLASGVGNVFSSFFCCMPYAASLSRSLIQQTVGGKTQLTSMVSCGALLLVLLFLGPFFQPLPYCVLSSIIVVALKGMLTQLGELPGICRGSRLDGLVWLSTFAGVVVLDIDYGLGLGLMASLASLLIRGQRTEITVLGRIPNTQTYVDSNRYRKAQPLPHILLLRIMGGLHFANSAAVKKNIMKLFLSFHKELSHFGGEKQTKSLTLIIDFSCVPFADPRAVKSLKSVYDDVSLLQSKVLFCGCLPPVYDYLTKSEHFESCTGLLIFHDVHDAVEHAKRSGGFDSLAKF